MDTNHLSLEYLTKIFVSSLKANGAYRHLYANTFSHEILISLKALQNQVKNSIGVSDKEEDSTISKMVTNIIFKNLPSIFPEHEGSARRYKIEYIKNTSTVFHIKISTENITSNIHKWISRKMSAPKNALYKALEQYNKNKVSQKDFLYLSHENDSKITYNMGYQVVNDILDFYTSRPGFSRKTLEQFTVEAIAELDKINNIKVGKSGERISFITFRAGRDKLKLAEKEKDKWVKAQSSLISLASKYASDLVVQKIESSMLEEILQNPEFKAKLIKGSGIKTPTNLSKTKVVKTQKITNIDTKTIPEDYKKQQETSVAQDKGITLRQLLYRLNMLLPNQVKNNMGRNGFLNYRTGRFAQSTHVQSVTNKNNKPLISFSYMHYPYKVFEKHMTRDPNIIIKKSIREIVSEMTKIKFEVKGV